MESIIRPSITDHFIDNNAFSNKQFGFIKGRRSTVKQLLKSHGYVDGIVRNRWSNQCWLY